MLEHNIIRRGQVDKALPESEKDLMFEAGGDKEYKVEAIINSAMYGQQTNDQMPSLYYLILWKGYPEEENTWEPSSTLIHLRKLISIFYKEHPEKPIAISSPFDSTPPMARPTVPKQKLKQKRGRPNKRANKRRRN